ncbi:Uncharacterized protein OBRU01_14670 [Operophtera brumata]|uniref:Endonuclease-reverse transcriptase n=1 Tax=Operophtera brumata TaxID=104452 RepID=A0A0L7L5U2_OPEBR|nr:Uncharacterized protein OBRU01_14670 [Operophtera brumata]
MEILKSDVSKLKSISSSPPTTSGTLETMMSEIRERQERSKNIIIMGVSEPLSDNIDERKSLDRKEVLKITGILNPDCLEPTYIVRIGKFNSNKHRPIKVCYGAQDTVKSLLRNKSNIKLDGLKVFSDQTPQQQMYMKHLKEQLKQRSDDGDRDLTINYIKGVPKIIKILPKH